MNVESLPLLVTMMIALSVASERVVEIVKGLVPFLTEENPDRRREYRRRAALQALAMVAGIFISFASWPVLKEIIPEASGKTVEFRDKLFMILALGLLASGGSGFWNSMLTYVTSIKDLKKTELRERAAREAGAGIPQPMEGELRP